MRDKDTTAVVIIIALSAFALGFLVASALYRPISEENYNELQKTEWYE